MGEIDLLFNVPEHLQGFATLNPSDLPFDINELGSHVVKEIECLACYYGSPSILSDGNISFPSILYGPPLIVQYEIFKYKTNQQFNLIAEETALSTIEK